MHPYLVTKNKCFHIEYGFSVEPKGLTPSFYEQVHGNDFIKVKDPEAKRLFEENRPKADAALTSHSEVELSVFTADCLPLLYFGEEWGDPIAAVHSGWRGSMKGIAKKVLDEFEGKAVHVALGPCILPCCFEVRDDFVQTFTSHWGKIDSYLEKRSEKLFFDLPEFVLKEQLASVPQCRIHTEALRCTLCSEPLLPSYRRQKNTDPRLRGWIRFAPTS